KWRVVPKTYPRQFNCLLPNVQLLKSKHDPLESLTPRLSSLDSHLLTLVSRLSTLQPDRATYGNPFSLGRGCFSAIPSATHRCPWRPRPLRATPRPPPR